MTVTYRYRDGRTVIDLGDGLLIRTYTLPDGAPFAVAQSVRSAVGFEGVDCLARARVAAVEMRG